MDFVPRRGSLRRRSNTVPPKVEYSLTPIAAGFLREISYVIVWGQLHFPEIMAARPPQ